MSVVHCIEQGKKPYIVVFGDGFSDIGNTDSSVLYTPTWFGRFSNGPVWNEYFSHDNNYTLISYAFGGSTLNSTFTSSVSGLSFNIPSFFDQFGMYNKTFSQLYNQNLVDNDIAVISFGSNEILAAMGEISNGSMDTDFFSDNIVNIMKEAITRLNNFGYKKIFITNILDIVSTPNFSSLPESYNKSVDELVIKTNKKLDNLVSLNFVEISTKKVDYVRVIDLYKFFSIVTSPEIAKNFNFTVVDKPCVTLNEDSTLNSTCKNQDEYVFYSKSHPTTKIHNLISNLFAQFVNSPNFNITDSSILQLANSHNFAISGSSKSNYLFNNDTENTGIINISEYTVDKSTKYSPQIISEKKSIKSNQNNDQTKTSSSQSNYNNFNSTFFIVIFIITLLQEFPFTRI
ncbi:Thermolabile hemolysin [Smittium culicis]|uniref:Thermolabile hemolysin n=1 Tax=Smittium culicis TaxID=133412 RepID=A0A1R1XMA5_9FUNG|nr:Thermolabile hemolysin [Smittium culicis]